MTGFSGLSTRLWAVLLFTVLSATAQTTAPTTAPAADPGWPRVYKADGYEVILHQPQVDSWDKYETLAIRAAVVIRKEGTTASHVGAIQATAPTSVDLDVRLVFIGPRKVTSLTFADTKPEDVEPLKQIMLDALPDEQPLTMSLDRVFAAVLAGKEEKPKEAQVNMDPPPIYASEYPAILVTLAGKPRFEKVDGTGLMFAANTNWDLFLDPASNQYYLLNGDAWLTTSDLLQGKWVPAQTLPADLSKLPDNDNWADVKKNIPGQKPKSIPLVIVSTSPAELIVTDGKPRFDAIPGTKLMVATNTDADLFLNLSENQYYYLAAGRWFRAPNLTGPWSAATFSLPKDFAAIPEDNDAADVLASVPGTPQAQEAVLQASTPRKATINRADVTVKVVYQGEPKFEPIPTTSIQYAVNTPFSVFLVSGKYYCCHEGVWFESPKSTGPWAVCTVVPPAIYTIPPTHPAYNVTYVRVYESTPTTVVVGSTSGYAGEYIVGGVVVFGAAVLVGALIANSDSWCFHYGSCYFSYGCGAHYSHFHGGYYTGGYARYGPYGGAGAWSSYNPATGVSSRGAFRYGPNGGAAVRTAYNPWTGNSAGRAVAATPYGSWGRSAVTNGEDWARGGHRAGPNGSIAGAQNSQGGAIVAGKGRNGSGAVVARDKDGDLYVGKNGNAYKRDEGGGWSKREDGEWKPASADRPQPRNDNRDSNNDVTRDLDRQAASRDRANRESAQATQRPSQPYARPSGGRGSRGGGGRRGR